MGLKQTAVLAVVLGWTCLPMGAAGDEGLQTGSVEVLLSSGEYQLVPAGEGQRIEMEGFGFLMTPGKPLLPEKKFFIGLPPGARIQSLEVEGVRAAELPGTYQIEPASALLALADPPLRSELEREMSREWQTNHQAVYSSDVAYPEEIGRLSGAGSLRQYAYAAVSFRPFRYFPQSGKLVHYDAARVVVHYRFPPPGSAESRRVEALGRDAIADRRAASLLVNFDEIRPLYELEDSPPRAGTSLYDYVIITTSPLASAIASSAFPAWKASLGYGVRTVLTTDTEIAAEPGADLAERIRNFLRDDYGPWGIRYVLLVGDYLAVPMRYCFPNPADHTHHPLNYANPGGSVPTDCYYADLSLPDAESWDLDGDGYLGEYGEDLPDFLTEVSVGRIPSNNTAWITFALNKLVAFEQDDGEWKDHALHGGAILFHENQNHDPIYPKIDGARVLAQIETDLMGGWTVSHYAEQAGLEPSDYPWPALSGAAFTGDWRTGQYAVVNWSGHGAPSGAYRLIWNWDDGDGVFETDGSDGYAWEMFVGDSMELESDYPSIIFAVSCSVGRPEPTGYGNFGVNLIADPAMGAAAGVVSATRPASITANWPSEPGATESICYEFNRFMIAGPSGPEKVGDALYDAKHYCNANYARDHYREYTDLYNFNLYGDPGLERRGIPTSVASSGRISSPASRLLKPNHPNPFNPTTEIPYTLPEDGSVRLEIIDVLGRRVATLVDEIQKAGDKVVQWDARQGGQVLASGVYFCRLEAGGTVEVRKMVLMK